MLNVCMVGHVLLRSTLTTSHGERPIPSEQENAELIAPDFVDAVKNGRDHQHVDVSRPPG
jgi:hypothetical protein